MLANPKTDDGNYHAIWNPTARIYDSVGKSKNLRCKCDVNYHAIRGPAPHFLDSVDRAAGEASLSLEKDATLVPEVSYFTVPFPASSHRLRAPAPYVRQSSTGVQILGGGAGCPSWDAKVHGDLRDFCHSVPYFFDSVANSDGKTPNGQRPLAKRQRAAWCF